MMKKIDQIWLELESETSATSGLLCKRLSGEIIPPVYVAMKYPEKLRCISVHLDAGTINSTVNISNLRDIRIEKMADINNPEKLFILIVLANNQHKDVFSTLSEDLINRVSSITVEKDLINQLITRLEKWRLLFEKIGQQGLSDEGQIGLYGELLFLRKFLHQAESKLFCISTWKGPERAVQDFQFSDWAVEIKTTHGKNQQKLHISSERQLDISLVPRIFLIHYSLEVRQSHGETLNNLVDNLQDLLSDDSSAYNTFQVKLLEAGYYDVHRHVYAGTGYSIRQEIIYRITDDFPKITEAQIASGVGDVSYSIVISSNENWTLTEEELFENISQE
jgi:hypothetical protein